MKKYILSLFLVGFLLTPAFSFAQLLEDTDPNPTASDCVALQNNLRYRDRDINKNGEVSTLQDFLQSKGYLNSEPTGYFGLLTFKAVKDFQKANDISPTGYVGPITRAKIKSLTCDGTVPTPDEGNGCLSGYLYSPMTGKRCSEISTKPLILDVSGPQTLNVNQTGTWTVKASSPSGGALSYSVDWGDVAYATCSYGVGCAVSPKVSQQSATFTHSYSQAGTYTPTFTVTSENTIRCNIAPCPSNGGSAQTSLSVNVGGVIATNRPQPPFNVRVAEAIIAEGSAKIYWENVNGEKFYVYKNKNDGPFQFLAVTNEKFYKDTSGLGMDIKYGYYVTALNSYGESDPSKKVYVGPISMPINPVISGISGPQTLNVNQTGTWKITASNSGGGNLTYSVVWGDEIYPLSSTVSNLSIRKTEDQLATFTHSYSQAETYTPKFTVTNANGQSANASLSVKVGNIISANHEPVLNLIAVPVNIYTDQSVNFTFSATDEDNDNLYWSIVWGNSGEGETCPSINSQQKQGWTNNVNHTWNMAGTYNVKVSVSDCRGGTASTSFSVRVTEADLTPPVISGVSGPQSLKVGEQGKWEVRATDSIKTAQLLYSVIWGDEAITGMPITASNYIKLVGQTATFTHIYNTAGIYQPKFKVSRVIMCLVAPCPSGPSAEASLSVSVKGIGSQSANVLSAFDSASGNVGQEPVVINYSAPSSSCPEFTMTLRMGMNNSQIKCLQKMLNEKGFKVEGVETGGGTTYFGLATLSALKAFQSSNNLIVDGVFGVNSRAALKGIVQ